MQQGSQKNIYDYKELNQRSSSYRETHSAQETFENVFAEELPVIREVMEMAFENALLELSQKPPSYQNRNSKAQRVNELVKGLLFDRFPDEMKENGERFFFEKGGYRLYFKKLSKKLRPSNIETKASQKILAQTQLVFSKENETVKIFIGYVTNTGWDEIKKICAVYISQNQNIWVTDLRLLRNNGPLQLPIFPQQSANNEPLIVKPKVKKTDGQDDISNLAG